jgi:hypothetical protein
VNIGLVLDTSALLAHLRLERISAGELIGEVSENGELTGIPALAVVQAWPLLAEDDLDRLWRMIAWDDGGTVVLPLVASDLIALHDTLPRVEGGQGVAQAVLEAGKHGCLLATDRLADLGTTIDPEDVVELS